MPSNEDGYNLASSRRTGYRLPVTSWPSCMDPAMLCSSPDIKLNKSGYSLKKILPVILFFLGRSSWPGVCFTPKTRPINALNKSVAAFLSLSGSNSAKDFRKITSTYRPIRAFEGSYGNNESLRHIRSNVLTQMGAPEQGSKNIECMQLTRRT